MRRYLLLISITICFSFQLNAQLLLEETFSYPANSSITGQIGGIGWGAPWLAQNGSGSFTTSSDFPIMGYPFYLFSGNYLKTGDPDYNSLGRRLDVTNNGSFSPYLDGNTIGTGTLWLGFMIRKNTPVSTASNRDGQVFLSLNETNVAWLDRGNPNKISIGYFNNNSNSVVGGVNTGYWTLKLFDETSAVYQRGNEPIATGNTFFIAVKISFGPTSTVEMFVNPALQVTPPATPTASLSTTGDISFSSLAIFGDIFVNASGFDEIRMGGRFQDLIPNIALLPIELTAFNARLQDDQVNISWTTAWELNNKNFEVQKSVDGINWKTIAHVDGVGTSDQMNRYDIVDNEPMKGNNYYRLRQNDYDGKFSFSNAIQVEVGNIRQDIRIFYDQSLTQINVFSNHSLEQIELFDLHGRQVAQQILPSNSFKHQIGTQGIKPGMYMVAIQSGGKRFFRKAMVIE